MSNSVQTKKSGAIDCRADSGSARNQPRMTGNSVSNRSGSGMFAIDIREGGADVVIMGKPTRKRATTMLNIPISEALRARLQEHIVGSVAMGSSALLEWALEELDRQHVSIQAQPQP